MGCHARDVQVEVGLAHRLVAGIDPREGPVGDAFARLECVDEDHFGALPGQVPSHTGSENTHTDDGNALTPFSGPDAHARPFSRSPTTSRHVFWNRMSQSPDVHEPGEAS